MQAKSNVLVLLIGVIAAFAAASPQQPAIAQDTGSTTKEAGQATPSSPTAGKALVYVYRPAARALTVARLLGYVQFFVNGDLLAELPNSGYASAEVPQGTIVFTSTDAYESPVTTFTRQNKMRNGRPLPVALRWPRCEGDHKKADCSWDASAQSPDKAGSGCASVNWKNVVEADSEDSALCRRELDATAVALDNWLDPGRKRKATILGFALPGILGMGQLAKGLSIPGGDFGAWLQACGTSPFPSPSSQESDRIRRNIENGDYSDNWTHCRGEVAEAYLMLSSKELLRIEVQAGKTYYVKWSALRSTFHPVKSNDQRPTKLELVDEATGASEISGLTKAP